MWGPRQERSTTGLQFRFLPGRLIGFGVPAQTSNAGSVRCDAWYWNYSIHHRL